MRTALAHANRHAALRFLLDLHHAEGAVELHGMARAEGRLLLRVTAAH